MQQSRLGVLISVPVTSRNLSGFQSLQTVCVLPTHSSFLHSPLICWALPLPLGIHFLSASSLGFFLLHPNLSLSFSNSTPHSGPV